MIAGLGLGQAWSPLWGPLPHHPYAVLECSPRRAARWVRENASIEDPFSSSAHRAATKVGAVRLERQLRLVVGSKVAVPPLWVLRAWVDMHFERCERPWAACLDHLLDDAEAAGRPARAGDLHVIEHLPAAARWAARSAPVVVLPAQPW